MPSKRIAPVDGLRAVAALGVLWIHNWLASGAPLAASFSMGPVTLDVQRFLALFGTGVDLFFVISGFCMYLMYVQKQKKGGLQTYKVFIARRWLRLAPAFYVAVVVCAIGYWRPGHAFPWPDLLAHATFTHTLFKNTNQIASPFWSLATEWHFYLVLPVLVWSILRWGFWPVFVLSAMMSLGFRAWVFNQDARTVSVLSLWLPSKIIEFLWGMAVARWFLLERPLPVWLKGNLGFLAAFAITLFGRILMTRETAGWSQGWGHWPRVLSDPCLSLGYALIVWNVISSESFFSRCLSQSIPQAIGRWSYSLYLWHWGLCMFFTHWMLSYFGPTLLTQYLGLALTLIILIPLSRLSYTWLEAPYFTRWRERVSQ